MSYSVGMDLPTLLLPLHLGALHPMETLVMALLALGPFVILAAVVTVVSRRDRRTEAVADNGGDAPSDVRPPGRSDAREP